MILATDTPEEMKVADTLATCAWPDGTTRRSSYSTVTSGGTKLTVDMRYSYYGNVIYARDWDRAGFMRI